MSAARLFRIADKVLMTAITVALVVAVPVSAVAFVVRTLSAPARVSGAETGFFDARRDAGQFA